jgi:hypothetical protein
MQVPEKVQRVSQANYHKPLVDHNDGKEVAKEMFLFC